MNQSHPKRRILLVAAVVALVALYSVQTAWSQSSNTTVNVSPQTSTGKVGDTFTVNIVVTNVQDLWALDLTVNWNASSLQLQTANSRLGVESYPDGVLHGNGLNYDQNSLASGDIYIEDNSTSQSAGEYHLTAASVGSSAAFSGTGNIVTLTFQITASGQSAIDVQCDLADKPASEETSNPIAHSDVGGSVEVVIPEFPALATVGLLLALATIVFVFFKKVAKKKERGYSKPSFR